MIKLKTSNSNLRSTSCCFGNGTRHKCYGGLEDINRSFDIWNGHAV